MFKQKTDYYGLGTSGIGLTLVGTTENKTESSVTAQGENGFVVAVEGFGVRSAPACEYIFTNNVTLSDIKFGKITTLSGHNYCLSQVEVNSQAGSAPTMTASGS